MPREASRPQLRSRSRSPYRPSQSYQDRHRSSSDRSRSPRRTRHAHHHTHHHHSRHVTKPSAAPTAPVSLPFKARNLTRHDLPTYQPMFTLYLDIQKSRLIEDMEEDEVKGRWKSFIGKWNDGKLAEGWYDPQTFEKAIASDNGVTSGNSKTISESRPGHMAPQTEQTRTGEYHDTGQGEGLDENDDDDDEFGPTLPGSRPDDASKSAPSSKRGPSIPKLHDLQHARDMATEDALSTRQQASKNLREDRKSEKALRTAHLEDIAPRAEPGTRERQLEKRRELAASNRAFASAKTDPTDVEVPEADVMGGEEGLGELKRLKEMEERKRSEREIRREEVMRAKREEREARLRQMRDKEERTMDMFREIARARFGGGGAGEGGGG